MLNKEACRHSQLSNLAVVQGQVFRLYGRLLAGQKLHQVVPACDWYLKSQPHPGALYGQFLLQLLKRLVTKKSTKPVR